MAAYGSRQQDIGDHRTSMASKRLHPSGCSRSTDSGTSSSQDEACKDHDQVFMTVDEACTDLDVADQVCVQRQAHAVFQQSEAMQEARLVISTIRPQEMCDHLRMARAVPVALKAALPNRSVIKGDPELVQTMQDARVTCDEYSDFVTELVRKINTSSNDLMRLARLVAQLCNRGAELINRVRNDNEAWNYEEIRPQVDKLEEEYNLIVDNMRKQCEALTSHLAGQRGKKLMNLQNRINGAENAEKGFARQLEKQAQTLKDHQNKVLKLTASIRYLKAIKASKHTSLGNLQQMLEKSQQTSDDYAKKLQDLEESKGQQLLELLQKFKEDREQTAAGLSAAHEPDQEAQGLQKEINAALRESSNLQMQIDVNEIKPHPIHHFVFIIDTSSSMKGVRQSALKQAVQQLAAKRSSTQLSGKDRVSVVQYAYYPVLRLFNASWSDLLLSSAMDEITGSFSFPCGAWKVVNDEIVSKVEPPPGQTLRTVFVFVTDGKASRDSSLTNSEFDAASAYRRASRGENQCVGFTLLLGEQATEHKLRGLVKAMNGGTDQLLDANQQPQKLCIWAKTDREIARKFERVTAWSCSAASGAHAKWQFSCERINKLQHLVGMREQHRTERIQKTLETTRASLQSLDVAEEDAKRQLEDNSRELHTFFSSMQSQHEDERLSLQESLDEVEKSIRKLDTDLAQQEAELGLEQDNLQTVKSAMSGEEFKQRYKEHLEQLRMDYSGYDVEKLNKLLTYAKAHMDNGQLLYTNFMESCMMATEPVHNMIVQLKQRNGSKINNVTGPLKVMQYYRKEAGLQLSGSTDSSANWEKILRKICPDVPLADIKDFAEIMQLADFCFSIEDEEARATKHAELRNKLNEGLLDIVPQLAEVARKTKSVEAEVKAAKKDYEREQAELQKAREDKERRDEIPELKDSVKEAKENWDEKKKELEEARADLDGELRAECGNKFSMMRKVINSIGAVYQGVLLANGVDGCEWSLKEMYSLFGSTIKDHCGNSAIIYDSFLKDIGVVDAERSIQLCLAASARLDSPGVAQLCDQPKQQQLPMIGR